MNIKPFLTRLALGILTLLFTFTIAVGQRYKYAPPWHESPKAAVNFTIDGIDNVPDLYGDINDPQLVIFFAGNQYMVAGEVIKAFKKEYPQYKRVFAETLPPGKLMKQIEGGSLVIGNLRITLSADIYTAGRPRVMEKEKLFSRIVPYAKNHLAIMVYEDNPLNIQSLKDLGREDVRVSMPNPKWEGIGSKIEKAYVKVGGSALKKQIMKIKVKTGTTILTKIHHRQSPLNILNKRSDAAPVWLSEVIYHQSIHHPVDLVEIPKDQNIFVTYMAGALKTAPHPKAASDFLDFLAGPIARKIYKNYGFESP